MYIYTYIHTYIWWRLIVTNSLASWWSSVTWRGTSCLLIPFKWWASSVNIRQSIQTTRPSQHRSVVVNFGEWPVITANVTRDHFYINLYTHTYILLYYIILYLYLYLYYIILYHIIIYYITLYYIILYYIISSFIILYCIMLYYIILYIYIYTYILYYIYTYINMCIYTYISHWIDWNLTDLLRRFAALAPVMAI